MHNEYPLKDKTIVVTGSSITMSILEKIERLGGEAIACPLIKIIEIVEPYDHMQLEMARNFDWLIFTSQNAVEAFIAKMNRHNLTPAHFSVNIAAVGSKTQQKLVDSGFEVKFIPSIFSADVFVKEFPKFAEPNSRCLFVRGKKAKDTIKTGLPFLVNEWNVYDTEGSIDYIQRLTNLLHNRDEMIIIFASPSAANVFASSIAPYVGWDKAKIASIGHVTTQTLLDYGAIVTYQPETYTMEAVLEEIIK